MLQEEDEKLNNGMLKRLECPVCLEYCTPPIYQCVTGHNVCAACRKKLQRCGICRLALTNTRNFFAEDVSRKLLVAGMKLAGSTRNLTVTAKTTGANPKLPLSTSVSRCYAVSSYSTVSSPTDQCSWEGRTPELLAHVEHEHRGTAVRTDEWDLSAEIRAVNYNHLYPKLLYAHKNLFWCMLYCYPNEKWHIYARLMGHETETSEYTCEFRLTSRCGRHTFVYYNTPLIQGQNILEGDASLSISDKMMDLFKFRNRFICSVKIIKVR